MKINEHSIRLRVIGSGYGESILLSISEKIFLAIDSNKYLYYQHEDGGTILDSFYNSHSNFPINIWVLTHFHHDHFQKFSTIIKDSNIEKILFPDDYLAEDIQDLIYHHTISNTESKISANEAKNEYTELKGIFAELGYNGASIGKGAMPIMNQKLIDDNGVECFLHVHVYAMDSKEVSTLRGKTLQKVINDGTIKSSGKIINKTSYITDIKYGNFQAAFLGDAPLTRINNYLDEDNNFDFDFIKIGHHGSKSSSDIDLIKRIKSSKDQIAVVTPYNKSRLPKKHIKDIYINNEFDLHQTSSSISDKRLMRQLNSIMNNSSNEFEIVEAFDINDCYCDFQFKSNSIIP